MKHFLTSIALEDLRSGADIGIDSRARGRDDGIEDLAADIRINGLLQPLGVWTDPETGVPYVAFGNRRLAALKFNASFIDHPPADLISCVDLRCDRAELLALSAVENLSRLALHPVDQYEAFAGMRATGLSIEEIGDRFGLDGNEVRKRLALGNLALEVREAWVAGTIDRDAAMAFAAAPDIDTQVRVLANLPPMNRTAHMVRWQMFGDTSQHAGDLAFVGRDWYLAAGGRLQEDLFAGLERVLDPAILSELIVSKAREEVIPQLSANEGWKWVEFDVLLTEAERMARYSWRRVYPAHAPLTAEQTARLETIEAWCEFGYDDHGKELSDEDMQALSDEAESINAAVETFTDEQKSNAGLIIRIKGDGSLERLAYVRPQDMAQTSASEAKTPKQTREASGEPAAVLAVAREAQTRGLAVALSQDPTAAKIALVATMLYAKGGGRFGSPVCVRVDGASAVALPEQPEFANFSEAVAHCRALSPSVLERLLGQLIGRAIDATSGARADAGWNSKLVTDDAVSAIADLVDPLALTELTHHALSLESYFEGATKGAALEAIKALSGEEEAGRWAKSKKGDIAKQAALLASQVFWLPPSIRAPRYKLPKVAKTATAAKPEGEDVPVADAPEIAKVDAPRKRPNRKAAAASS